MTNARVSEERLRNTRAWAAARVGILSGADVIVAAIDELLERRAAEQTDPPTHQGMAPADAEELMRRLDERR